MIADAPKTKDLPVDDEGNVIENMDDIPQLTTKEDIKNYLKGGLL